MAHDHKSGPRREQEAQSSAAGQPPSPVGEYIAALLASSRLGGQVTHHRLLPGTDPEFASSRRPWPGALERLLRERGVRLYSHQALATDHIRAGRSVVVATPTASGKSLIYNLPVLERHLLDPEARALYLFPLKALAQDQLAAFTALTSSWPEAARPAAALYDGDTSDHFRRKIRRNPPTVLISNPEMLHLGILPHHEQWAPFLAGLTHVVVDEAHMYRGVLGAHMAHVFRRLNRLAGRYGAQPVYVLCTATVGNPGELAAALTGLDVPGAGAARRAQGPVVIDHSGAPRGPRHFVFLNPDQSPATAAIDLLKAALARNLRSIVYCRSRRMTELVSLWAGSQSGPYRERISAYRAGFLPEERRAVEARMASGELLAVVSTSALELGIDIGGLDVCILVGYPGTVMATLQRGGRVGRARQESAVIVVAGEDALDQYFARNPEDFFSRPPERAVVNPDNEVILARHLECAAAELPLRLDEPWLRSPAARSAARALCAQSLLLQSADGATLLAARKRPQRLVDLRGTGRTFDIEDQEGRLIGSVDGFRAWRETHPGAVYLHRGRSYVIEEIDPGRARVLAKEAKTSWFTRTRGQKSTDILEESERRALGRGLVCRGRLRITERITGYEKRATSGNRLLTIVPLDAPPQVFETEGLWYVIPDAIRAGLEERFLHFMGSIHALEHAAIGLMPLLVMADRNDFGGISTPLHPQVGLPCVFIYDGLPGGAGLTRQGFAAARELLEATRRAIAACPCEDGCPSCVHSPKCGSGNRPISKEGALALLDELLAPGAEGERLCRELRISPAPDRLSESVAQAAAAQAPAFPASGPRNNFSALKTQGDAAQAARAEVAAPVAPAAPPSPEPLAGEALARHLPVPPPRHFVVFDVETRRSAAEVGGWNRAGQMGVSVAVLYDSTADDYFSYRQEELPALFERLRAADLVVGFNSLRFDYAVLAPFAPFELRSLPSLDLLQRVHERLNYRVSLNNIGQATLGEPKSADGLQALQWWKQGRCEEIAAYCRKDVDLTRRLYLFGLAEGYVLFSNKAGQRVRLPVDFRARP
ncbi:DEAD/DEAH box helicase [Desulfovibrio sp. ZJ369]|uniref:DEAD/DEAH box helicase n=1 Tax=Desulfovibrio sp. ZJ369 TaxID=2709793 RepID=UPI0013EDFDFA|nr:DEAD/DEAH box helicase [Desulfovibrio sp. ZJ369]